MSASKLVTFMLALASFTGCSDLTAPHKPPPQPNRTPVVNILVIVYVP